MDKNRITDDETRNDGQTINLYYDDMAGLYMAFGMSAYYADMVTEPYMSYSEEMQMPVALLRRPLIMYMRQSLNKVEHKQHSFYRFKMRLPVGDKGYKKWAEKIKIKHDAVR